MYLRYVSINYIYIISIHKTNSRKLNDHLTILSVVTLRFEAPFYKSFTYMAKEKKQEPLYNLLFTKINFIEKTAKNLNNINQFNRKFQFHVVLYQF